MCLPALVVSLVRFLGLLGEAMKELLQRNGFRALCFSGVCECRMLMQNAYVQCNIYRQTQVLSHDTLKQHKQKNLELPNHCNFGFKSTYLISH